MMVVASLMSAPGYYLIRAAQGEQGMQLVGMIVMLVGPMFLMVVISLLLSLTGWWNRR